ncbi:hypothetical protein BASA60_001545 [Batrachochytrium salamandrivorans]|nr:hypothetical protein BASA60_001545 [Batrachochytrium salamandrivorans]KAH9271558.1 hypothetical protein BASA83_006166 [Batrachochytrium salamandrivorans]
MLAPVISIVAVVAAMTHNMVMAQTPDCFPNFQPCLDITASFLSLTCSPLQRTNATHYQSCRCYYFVNMANCYLQCPNDATIQQQLTGTINPSIASECALANLNPKALPQPAPWQVWVAPSVVPSPAPSSTAGATGAASSSPSPAAPPANGGSVKSAAMGPIESVQVVAAIASGLSVMAVIYMAI